MARPQPAIPFTAEDYLEWEAGQLDKHEYFHGETFAMGGASRRHVTISLNVAAALDGALEGSPCRAYMAEMKVQAAADEAYFYPAVLVTCDPADHRADHFMRAHADRRGPLPRHRCLRPRREVRRLSPHRLAAAQSPPRRHRLGHHHLRAGRHGGTGQRRLGAADRGGVLRVRGGVLSLA